MINNHERLNIERLKQKFFHLSNFYLKAKEFLADVSGETELIGQSNP